MAATDRIILGIDPGTIVMGYGLLQVQGTKLSPIGIGVIKLDKLEDHALRLQRIFERTVGIIDEFKPDELAIEAPFFGKNVQSMLKLGRAQGVAIAAALSRNIPIIPLGTTRWGGPPVVALVPHLFGGTAFQELAAPLASAVWLAERPLGRIYRGAPFQAISVSTAEDLAARGIPRDSIEVIHPGIDTIGYTPAPGTRAAQPVFAYLGRLKRYKGVHHVVRAFAALGHPTATLEIAGAGDYRPALERLAASLDLGERVRFLGRVSEAEKRSLLRRAWALVFASPKEGWGITNLEAAASGTPVVASNSPGIRESVRDGETGYLVPHGDIGAMAAAMGRLASDPALVERLGVQARRFAETFTWERAAEETERHLEQVLISRRGS